MKKHTSPEFHGTARLSETRQSLCCAKKKSGALVAQGAATDGVGKVSERHQTH